MMCGKFVFEVKPSDADKARSVEVFMRHDPFVGRIPVFVGDDAPMRTALRRLRGSVGTPFESVQCRPVCRGIVWGVQARYGPGSSAW